jgi:hypothetical protein
LSLKLLMTWDIQSGREQDYFEFVVREFLPNIQRLGLEPSDAWFTMYGECPQILTGVVSENRAALDSVLSSEDWTKLTNRLMDYVENFNYKVVPAKTGFQM